MTARDPSGFACRSREPRYGCFAVVAATSPEEMLADATVLLVEDDEAIREALVETLERRGYRVVDASNGKAAIERARAGAIRPDVIVLDLAMPVMDGDAFLRAQSSEPLLAGVPVIVVTARLRRPEPLTSTVRGVLVKPLSTPMLLDMIDRASGAS